MKEKKRVTYVSAPVEKADRDLFSRLCKIVEDRTAAWVLRRFVLGYIRENKDKEAPE